MPRPTATIEMKLTREAVRTRARDLALLAETVEQMRGTHGNRAATELLLNGIGLEPTRVRNDAYYREMLDYQLGVLQAHLGQPAAAADLIRRSGALPHSGGNGLFPDIIAEGIELDAAASAAARRGMPPILIAAMPRGGSASLTQSIAATLDMPIVRLSTGVFPNFALMPSWLERFSAGGALTHDHLGASDHNLGILENAGWKHVFVLIRDPRAAAASFVRMVEEGGGRAVAGPEVERAIVDVATADYISWLNSWVAAEQRSRLAVHWIRYGEVRADPGPVIRRMVATLQPDHPALAAMRDVPVRAVTANFAVGRDDAWRSSVGAEAARQLWQAMSPRAIALLGLEP